MKVGLSQSDKDILEAVGARLVIERHERGLSQAEMAKRLGVSKRTYQTYELGERQMSVLSIFRANESLGIEPTWLVTGETPMVDSQEVRRFIEDFYYYCKETGFELSEPKKAAIISKAVNRILKREPISEDDLAVWVDLILEV